MTLEEVLERAQGEAPRQPGYPEYLDRPWSQLFDEMTMEGARTVCDLPPARVDVFFHPPRAVYGGMDLGSEE